MVVLEIDYCGIVEAFSKVLLLGHRHVLQSTSCRIVWSSEWSGVASVLPAFIAGRVCFSVLIVSGLLLVWAW